MLVHALPAFDRPPADPCPGILTDLVLRCARGDEAALGRLFDVVFPLIRAIVVRSAASSGTTDDRVVAAFTRIWRCATEYDPATPVVAWLMGQVADVPGCRSPALAGQ